MADDLPIALRFRQLCEQAAKETDSQKLLELTDARSIGYLTNARKPSGLTACWTRAVLACVAVPQVSVFVSPSSPVASPWSCCCLL